MGSLIGPIYSQYFTEENLVPSFTTVALPEEEHSRINWEYEAQFKANVAVVDGTWNTCVSPKDFKGRHPEEPWSMWLNPHIGDSGSWFHRFIQINGQKCEFWMDLFGQTRELAVMVLDHHMTKTKAKTPRGSFVDDKWHHYAITFTSEGQCVVYVDGAVVSRCQMKAVVAQKGV